MKKQNIFNTIATTTLAIAAGVILTQYSLPGPEQMGALGSPNGYPDSEPYRIKITVQKTKIAGALANFPVYFNLANLGPANPFWGHIQSTGADLLITESDGQAQVPLEVVAIDSAAKTGEIWFRSTAISSSTNIEFYLYYGSSTRAQIASTTTYGARAVWSQNYAAVYHLGNNSFRDSVGTYNGTNVGTTATSSKIGGATGARTFNGTSNGIALGDIDLTNMTLSAWISPKPTQANNAKIIVKTTVAASAPYVMYNLTYNATTPKLLRTEISVVTTQYGVTAVAGIVSGSYNYVASTFDSAYLRFYYNGAANGTPLAQTGNIAVNNDPTQIGRGYFGGTAIKEWFAGAIDEVHICSVARTAKWLLTEYNNQNTASTFYATSTEEDLNPAPPSEALDSEMMRFGNL